MNLQILRLSLPFILSQGVQTIMFLTDRYFLSLKNTLYASAATTAGFTALSFSLFFIHLLLFSTSLIAKKYGEKDSRCCHVIVKQCFFISAVSIPVLLFLSNAGDWYFQLLGHDAHYLTVESEYFHVVLLSQIFVLFRTAIESYFLGIDRSKSILSASLIGMLGNIPLTYLLVLGPFADVFHGACGAAWSTLCANILSLFYLAFLYLQTTDKKEHEISWREILWKSEWSQLLRQGSYTGLEKFVNSFCFVGFVNMFVSYGREVAAAISIVFSWDQIAFLPIMGMYGAVMSLYSRFLGEKNPGGAVRSFHAAVRMTLALMGALAIIFWTCSDILIASFLRGIPMETDTSLVYSYSSFFFRTTCLYIFANAIIFLYKAALRSLGLSSWCFNLSFFVHILLVVNTYFAIYVYKMDPKTVWWFFMSMLGVLAISLMSKFYRIVKVNGLIELL